MNNYLNTILNSAKSISQEYENGFIGTEHLLWAILNMTDTFVDLESKLGISREDLSNLLTSAMYDVGKISKEVTHKTPRVQNIIAHFLDRVKFEGNYRKVFVEELINGGNGVARRILGENGKILPDLVQTPNETEKTSYEELPKESIEESKREEPRYLNPIPIDIQFLQSSYPALGRIAPKKISYGNNIADRDLSLMNSMKKLTLPKGRDRELFEILKVLAKTRQNNPVIVADRGVGKTALIEGLPAFLKREGGALAASTSILEIGRNKVLEIAGDHDKEKEFKKFLQAPYPSQLLVFDYVLELYDEERLTWNLLSMLNEIKRAVCEGQIRAIFITTPDMYSKLYLKDPMLASCCEKIALRELDKQSSIEVLEEAAREMSQQHRIEIPKPLIKKSVELAEEFIKRGYFPTKALNLLDTACANASVTHRKQLTQEDLEECTASIASLPIEKIRKRTPSLNGIEATLKSKIIGQDSAIEKVCDRIRLFITGLNNDNRPLGVILFAGPTGVGKTELAKLIAQEVFGGTEHCHRFDMSEYSQPHEVSRLIGAPPGYTGYQEDGQLTGAVRKDPHAVILLDEFEKSHDKIFNIFLQVFDAGRLTDGKGDVVDLRNCLIIMTSNMGADLAAARYQDPDLSEEVLHDQLIELLKHRFSMEFLNRIDDLILFNILNKQDIIKICNIFVEEWKEKLAKTGNILEISPEVIENIADTNFDPAFGARNMRRSIESTLMIPLSRKMAELDRGEKSLLTVKLEDGKYVIEAESI